MRYVALIAVVAAGLGVAAMQSEPDPVLSFDPPPFLDGSAGAYDMTLWGGWHYAHMVAGETVPGPRFEVAGIDGVRNEDGDLVQAMRVLWQGPATTLLPTDPWSQQREIQWTDGHQIAVQRGAPGSSTWSYPSTANCLFVAEPGPLPRDCEIPGLRIVLPAGTEVQSGMDGQWMHLRAGDDVRMEWWYASEISVPMRVEVSAAGAPGLEPRSLRLDLTGFLPGTGATPLASAIAGHALEWLPRHTWGPDDRGVDHPFPLSKAYSAARANWPDLHKWLADHPGAYVFMADYDEKEHDGVHSWRIHMSDGEEGFSFRVTQSQAIVPLLGPDVKFQRLQTSELAPAAPEQPPLTMPSVASLWQRWSDHASSNEANMWGFRVLEAHGEPVVQYVAGSGRSLDWGLHPLVEATPHASILVLDGSGKALRFDETDPLIAREPVPSPPYAPASLPYSPPWVPATSAGIFILAIFLPKLLAALFTRFQPHQLLEHPTREAVMDAIQAEPGIHFGALCSRLERNPGQVRHHVRKLLEGRLLVARTTPGYTCYYPYAGTPRTLIDAGPLLRSEGARNLLNAITTMPGACSKDLAAAAGLSPATATYHLKRMQQAGLVDAVRDGKAMRMHLSCGGREALDALPAGYEHRPV